MPIAAGETFERYEVEALIGRGGMGEVYRATDTKLRRKVALKVLRAGHEGPEGVARMFREARAAAALSHPNTIAIHDLGETDGTVYLVMEYISGKPLLAYVGEETAGVLTKVGWLVGIARALSAAHKAGVVHRDVKPSNVMITDDQAVKVLDFGLAKPHATSGPASFTTKQGHQLGTPRYMAPEVLEGRDADERSDQYSFGVTAYELLSGAHPGPPGEQLFPPLDAVDPRVPAGVSKAIARALSADPAARFATLDDLAEALEASVRISAAIPTVRDESPPTMDGPGASPVAASVDAPPKPKPDFMRTKLSQERPEGLVVEAKEPLVELARGKTLPLAKSPVIVPPPQALRAREPVSPPAPAPAVFASGSTPPPGVPRDAAASLPRMALVVGVVSLAFGIGATALVIQMRSPAPSAPVPAPKGVASEPTAAPPPTPAPLPQASGTGSASAAASSAPALPRKVPTHVKDVKVNGDLGF